MGLEGRSLLYLYLDSMTLSDVTSSLQSDMTPHSFTVRLYFDSNVVVVLDLDNRTALNVWHHTCVVRDENKELRLHLDGQENSLGKGKKRLRLSIPLQSALCKVSSSVQRNEEKKLLYVPYGI